MKRTLSLFSAILIITALPLHAALASENTTISLPPVSQLVPRTEGAGTTLRPLINVANAVHAGALTLAYVINDYRLEQQTEQALKASLPDGIKLLKETGTKGVLLEARYVRDNATNAMGSMVGPPNLTQELLGNRFSIVGAGAAPVEVLAIALKQESFERSPGKGQEFVPNATRDFWLTIDSAGNAAVAEVDNPSLYRSARDLVSNAGLFTQMHAAAYRYALTNMISAAEHDAISIEAKQEAGRLLTARNEALRKLEDIDRRLRQELERAKRANRDADAFALVAALSGLAGTILEANKPEGPGSSANSSTNLRVDRILTPSGAVLELLRLRQEIQGDVVRNDLAVGAYLEKNGKVVYVPLR